MSELEMSREYSCGYCWGKLECMTDCRMLPCGHPCCGPCLHADSTEQGRVKCPNCRQVYETLQIADIPKYQLGDGQISPDVATNQSSGGGRLMEVKTDSATNEKELRAGCCQTHPNKVLSEICTSCDKLVCTECEPLEMHCKATEEQHKFSSLAAADEATTSLYRSLLESAEDKITAMCKLSKEAWRQLDAEEENCAYVLSGGKSKRNEQVTEVNKVAKVKTDDHLREVTNRVEALDTKLTAKQEELREMCCHIQKLVRDGGVVERAQQKDRVTRELEDSLNIDPIITEMSHISRTCCTYNFLTQTVEMAKIPTSLTLKREAQAGNCCFTACHLSTGDLLVGCFDGLYQLNYHTNMFIRLTNLKNVTSIKEYHGIIYFVHENNGIWEVAKWSPSADKMWKLLEFPKTDADAVSIAISEKYAIVDNPTKKEMIIYDMINKSKHHQPLDAVRYPYFLPDGKLLAITQDKLVKYQLKDGELSEVWTCEGLTDILTVCADTDGLIYVATQKSRQSLYIISPQGTKLKELEHSSLPDTAGLISIRGNELVVPGWHDERLHLFNLNL